MDVKGGRVMPAGSGLFHNYVRMIFYVILNFLTKYAVRYNKG